MQEELVLRIRCLADQRDLFGIVQIDDSISITGTTLRQRPTYPFELIDSNCHYTAPRG